MTHLDTEEPIRFFGDEDMDLIFPKGTVAEEIQQQEGNLNTFSLQIFIRKKNYSSNNVKCKYFETSITKKKTILNCSKCLKPNALLT